MKNVTEKDELTLEIDEYVPLFAYIGSNKSSNLYLRFVSKTTLVELGISELSGLLESINLIQISGLRIRDFPVTDLEVVNELPQFDLSLWRNKKTVDIDAEATASIADNTFFLIFNEIEIAQKIWQYDSLQLAFGNARLCWIAIQNLSDGQIAKIEKSILDNASGGFL
ncbi:hypothetical protein UNDYM_4164 [Undibacterium sp. YM2]|nr:hypothetical protein UNDYM_4164 [Undibacterium sp. YM2]